MRAGSKAMLARLIRYIRRMIAPVASAHELPYWAWHGLPDSVARAFAERWYLNHADYRQSRSGWMHEYGLTPQGSLRFHRCICRSERYRLLCINGASHDEADRLCEVL